VARGAAGRAAGAFGDGGAAGPGDVARGGAGARAGAAGGVDRVAARGGAAGRAAPGCWRHAGRVGHTPPPVDGALPLPGGGAPPRDGRFSGGACRSLPSAAAAALRDRPRAAATVRLLAASPLAGPADAAVSPEITGCTAAPSPGVVPVAAAAAAAALAPRAALRPVVAARARPAASTGLRRAYRAAR